MEMTKCEKCGHLRPFENIPCRVCDAYERAKAKALRSKDDWIERVKKCACGKHANVIFNDTYLCGVCHG